MDKESNEVLAFLNAAKFASQFSLQQVQLAQQAAKSYGLNICDIITPEEYRVIEQNAAFAALKHQLNNPPSETIDDVVAQYIKTIDMLWNDYAYSKQQVKELLPLYDLCQLYIAKFYLERFKRNSNEHYLLNWIKEHLASSSQFNMVDLPNDIDQIEDLINKSIALKSEDMPIVA